MIHPENDGAVCRPPSCRKSWLLMNVTFNDLFTFVIMLVAVITLFKDNKQKNNALTLARCSVIF